MLLKFKHSNSCLLFSSEVLMESSNLTTTQNNHKQMPISDAAGSHNENANNSVVFSNRSYYPVYHNLNSPYDQQIYSSSGEFHGYYH